MARIPLQIEGRTKKVPLTVRIALRFVRRQYGKDFESAMAMSHHPGVLWPWSLMEMAGRGRRTRLPQHLDDLVQLIAAVHIGCSWCIDFGAHLWEQKGLDQEVLLDAVRWRDSPRFDDDAQAAFEFAEAASGDLDQVTDEMITDLRRRFGDDGVVELAYLVALENMRSRFNSSLGLRSQGFSSGKACSLAARQRVLGRPAPVAG